MIPTLALLVLTAAPPVPDVVVGPDLALEAPTVEAPIVSATVFSDRARVRRGGRARLSAGVVALRLPDLPGATLLDTVRVSVAGARVLRVEAVPVELDHIPVKEVAALVEALERASDAVDAVVRLRAIDETELELVTGVQPTAPLAEAQRDGRPALSIDVAAWGRALDFLGQRSEAARTRIRASEASQHTLEEKRDAIVTELARYHGASMATRVVRVLAVVESANARTAELELEYFVPSASWRPVYDLRFDAGAGSLSLASAALVHQGSGEDWNDVKLELSTSIPGVGIDYPKLLTWTLGEKKDFVPVPRAARQPPVAPRYGHPGATTSAGEREASAERDGLRARIASAIARASSGPLGGGLGDAIGHGGLGTRGRGAGGGGYGSGAGTLGAKRSRPAPRRAPPPPPPAEPMPSMAPPPAPPGYAMDDEVMEGALMAPQAESIVSKSSLSVSGRAARAERVRFTSLGLFDSPIDPRPRFSDPNLPAVAAGGLDYVFLAPTSVRIPGNGEAHRVPLAVESFPVTTFLEATPSLSTTAYLKATVTNARERPLLAGPFNIFVGGEFAGEGRLQTTGPGGTVDFPLGADEDIRLNRKVLPTTKTEGVFSKDDITEYRTIVEVGNYKRKAVRVRIHDQIPKSSHEDVEVKLVDVSPPPDLPDEQGILHWTLEVPPGKTRQIELRYTIRRPANWQLQQH